MKAIELSVGRADLIEQLFLEVAASPNQIS
jgi:hypothetical protein